MLATACSYDSFIALALDTDPAFKWDFCAFLEDALGVTEAGIVKHFFGYTEADIEGAGFPKFEDVGWYDRLLNLDAMLRSRMKRLLSERIGSPELILNFYRDPLG